MFICKAKSKFVFLGGHECMKTKITVRYGDRRGEVKLQNIILTYVRS
jgi:hypothetical protein